MTLYELGEDYLEQNRYLEEKIKRLNKELKQKSGNDYICLKRDLCLLYKMSSELRDTAYILMHYYEDDGKKQYHPLNGFTVVGTI